tara:strand:- start:29344 stop:29691 length:348 start_codon:yes stop_codon:yes gene_type:complete
MFKAGNLVRFKVIWYSDSLGFGRGYPLSHSADYLGRAITPHQASRDFAFQRVIKSGTLALITSMREDFDSNYNPAKPNDRRCNLTIVENTNHSSERDEVLCDLFYVPTDILELVS